MPTRRTTGRRYDPAKLLELFPEHTPGSNRVGCGTAVEGSARWVADRLGVSERRVQRWRRGVMQLNRWDADRFAVHLGLHPAQIWPEWLEDNGPAGTDYDRLLDQVST